MRIMRTLASCHPPLPPPPPPAHAAPPSHAAPPAHAALPPLPACSSCSSLSRSLSSSSSFPFVCSPLPSSSPPAVAQPPPPSQADLTPGGLCCLSRPRTITQQKYTHDAHTQTLHAGS
eukprot:GHVU01134590.1.p2 GENE.GHVU01134590.1~~GHVU01134590.1.p2  ORF type:complete len:118 (-),score=19.95 GHVU01134590.1:343-696(-)